MCLEFSNWEFLSLTPTSREEAGILISLMERYDWSTFSLIIDPRLPREQVLLQKFEEHNNEQRTWEA